MSSLSIFKCISCSKEYNINEIRYRCECGDLLEVLHDFSNAIPNTAKWKKSLNDKISIPPFIRYQDILFPSLPKKHIISLNECQ